MIETIHNISAEFSSSNIHLLDYLQLGYLKLNLS